MPMKKIAALLILLSLFTCSALAGSSSWYCVNGHSAKDNYCSVCGTAREAAELLFATRLRLERPSNLNSRTEVTAVAFMWVDLDAIKGPTAYVQEGRKYAMLKLDFLNTDVRDTMYCSRVTVKAYYQDRYVYEGSLLQMIDPDKTKCREHEEAVIPMGVGHYAAVCELPVAAVNGAGALYLELSLGEHRMIYRIRE